MATKIKVKTIKQTSEDPDIASIFSEMMNGNIKLSIVHKKYEEMLKHVNRFFKLVELIKLDCVSPVLELVDEYCQEFKEMITTEFNAEDLTPYLINQISERDAYNNIPTANKDLYISVYKRIKDCKPVNIIINTLHEVNNVRKNLVDENKDVKSGEKRFVEKKELKGVFLIKHPDPVYAPVAGLPSLNLKDMYLNADGELKRLYILKWIQKLFMICYDLYDATNIPDIDPNDMVEVVLVSIEQLKKKIPRCEKAFNKIRESVGLLKDNFNGYYAQFVESNNPSIIIESFIGDVSETSGNDPTLAKEFRDIINYYKKMVLQNKQFGNSKISKLFSHVDKQLNILSDITGEDYSTENEEELLANVDADAETAAEDDADEDTTGLPTIDETDTETLLAQQNFMEMILGKGTELSDDVKDAEE